MHHYLPRLSLGSPSSVHSVGKHELLPIHRETAFMSKFREISAGKFMSKVPDDQAFQASPVCDDSSLLLVSYSVVYGALSILRTWR